MCTDQSYPWLIHGPSRFLLRAFTLCIVLGGAAACAVAGAGGSGDAEARAAAESPHLYGRVLNADKTPAVKAKVWTVPDSRVVDTDSLGNFEIREGLVPGEYVVHAELQDVQGLTRKVPTRLRKRTDVVVFLGGGETTFSPMDWDSTTAKGSKGPGRVRGAGGGR
jgi:hypothetical protein